MYRNKEAEIMNLIGYGLAKFSLEFINQFGFQTKSSFSRYIVNLNLAKTEKAVSNRQDSFDPYFDNGRRGWWQRTQRKHIKIFIDNLFGEENVEDYANIIKYLIQTNHENTKLEFESIEKISPIIKSKFRQLQETGKEAEYYFMSHFQSIEKFKNSSIDDARLWGDGYDFQIQLNNKFFLVEIKGIKDKKGSIRMTKNEFKKAQEYKNNYILIVISNLSHVPKMNILENPLQELRLTRKELVSTQINYHSEYLKW